MAEGVDLKEVLDVVKVRSVASRRTCECKCEG